MTKIIGLLPCAGPANRIFNLPKFILPLKNKNCSLITNWCNILLNNNCDYIIIGTSDNNKPFIEHILNTQLINFIDKIKIINIQNSITMNDTIIQMLKNEIYDFAIMGMPDTFIDKLSLNLIEKINNNCIVGAYLWNIRKSQEKKIGLCDINDNYIINIIDKTDNTPFKYGWGSIIFKKEFEKFIHINDLHLGYSMKLAIDNNINIPYHINSGFYWDCGTIDEYKEYLNFLEPVKPIFIKDLLIIITVNNVIDDNELFNNLTKLRNKYKNEIIVTNHFNVIFEKFDIIYVDNYNILNYFNANKYFYVNY